jgi:hypothetical protein
MKGSSPQAYMAAIGINEILWAKHYAQPRINAYRSIEVCETPEEYISLLDRFLRIVAPLSPIPCDTALSHPDLHLDNICIDPDTMEISCIIDWQSASVSEPFFQPDIPRMLLQVVCSPPSGSNSDITSNLLLQYKDLSRLKNKQQWNAKEFGRRSPLIEAAALLTGAWTRNDMFSLRHAMIDIVARWNSIVLTADLCPIDFSEMELESHQAELENLEGFKEVLHQLEKDNHIPLGGMIPRGKYEHALYVNNTVKEMFVNLAEDESQKQLYSKIWPYQDREP